MSKPVTSNTEFRPPPICLGVLLGLLAGTAAANPQGPQVVNGTIGLSTPDPNTLNITNTPGAIINWQSFSIQHNETTRFIQSSASSAVLNRITGGDPSQILGSLLSNGKVFLINPNGIVFGPDSVVDTAGLVASTLNMTDADFLAGRLHFEGDSAAGAIRNQGYIKAGAHGDVFLIAPNIENSGIVETQGGQLVLAAGQKVLLTSLDSDYMSFEVQAPENSVVNLGKLIAHGGAARAFAGTIRNSGSIEADSVEVDATGAVVLRASHEVALEGGSAISASGTAGHNGGSVTVTAGSQGDHGAIRQDGEIHADGDRGGSVAVKAGWVETRGTISADGRRDGGSVEITATDHVRTNVSTVISARGGAGKGGRITAEADSLYTSGRYDATGRTGGDVKLLGKEVKLAAATVDASGERGGGSVRVGGGFHGAEPIRNAENTVVNASTTLKADATKSGDGGEVVVWSEQRTRFAGNISARGGSESGNGGSVEVSGKDTLAMSGNVDVTAANGHAGTLLLDPKKIIIIPGGGSIDLVDPTPFASDQFGSFSDLVTTLGNGNILVTNPNAMVGSLSKAGEVFLFTPSGGFLGSVQGTAANEQLGSIFPTRFFSGNFNYVIQSPDISNPSGSGAVVLVSGTTGTEIGRVTGATAGEHLGNSVDFFTLGFGNNYIILSANASPGGLAGAGSVILTSSATGQAIGRIDGAHTGDNLGNLGVQGLGGNYVIRDPTAAEGGLLDSGAVILASGTTGLELGRVSGASAGEQLGHNFLDFVGSNYAIRSENASSGGFTNNGAVILASGSNGIEIGRVSGTGNNEFLGQSGIVTRGSGNYVIPSPNASPGGVTNAGAVILASGTTGLQIGRLDGNTAGEQLGSTCCLGGPHTDFFSLGFDDFLIYSPNNSGGAGTVILAADIDLGSGNIERGRVTGTTSTEALGTNNVDFIGGGHYVIRSENASSGVFTNNGAVILVNQSTGQEVGGAGNGRVEGNSNNEFLGQKFLDFAFNGDYIVRSPGADGSGTNRGAVILVNHTTGLETGRVTGGSDGDQLGEDVFFGTPITFLGSGDYVVRDPIAAAGGINRGVVILVDQITGQEKGGAGLGRVSGTSDNEKLGQDDIHDRASGNYVITSPLADPGGITDAGSVILASGATGRQIGRIDGNHAGEQLGSNVDFFPNGSFSDYLITATLHDNSPVAGAGAVILGTDIDLGGGNIERGRVSGNAAGEGLGSIPVTFFGSNYIILSPNNDNGPATAAGAVILANGSTGNEIGRVSGNFANDNLGNRSIQFFGSNYLVLAPNTDDGGTDAGSVILVSGTTGTAIGRVDGASAREGLGNNQVDPFGSNYVIRSDLADSGGFTDNGAVILVNGTTGTEIGRVSGNASFEFLGNFGINTLGGNYFIQSPDAASGALSQAGAVILINGTTGTEIGRLSGVSASERLGNLFPTFTAGGNLFIRSPNADVGGNIDAGSIVLMSGTTGTQLGRVDGNAAGEFLGNGSFFPVPGGNFVAFSPNAASGAVAGAGAVIMINPTTGNELGRVSGNSTNEHLSNLSISFVSGGNYFIRSPNASNGALTQAGAIIWASGTTGTEIGRLSGGSTAEQLGNFFPAFLGNGNIVIRSPLADPGGLADAGTVILAAESNGAEIGRVDGISAGEQFGNGSFVQTFNITRDILVASPNESIGSLMNAGAIVQINGTTGKEVTRVTGLSAGEQLGNLGIDQFSIPGKFIVRSPNATEQGAANAGRIVLLDPNSSGGGFASSEFFSTAPSGDSTIGAQSIANFLNTGGSLVLQANNDITVLAGAVIAASGGSLTLQAGRSVIIQGVILDKDGSVRIVANETAANGVDLANRDPGNGDLMLTATTAGVKVEAGTLDVSAQNILLEGGTAQDAFAALIGNAGAKISAETITLMAGTGPNADAVILAPSGNLTLTGVCTGCNELFVDPLLDPGTQTGVFKGSPNFQIAIDSVLALGDAGKALEQDRSNEKEEKKKGTGRCK